MVASTAAYVASEIGATNAFAYDLQAACSSFLFGMSTAASYIESGRYKKVFLLEQIKCPLLLIIPIGLLVLFLEMVPEQYFLNPIQKVWVYRMNI